MGWRDDVMNSFVSIGLWRLFKYLKTFFFSAFARILKAEFDITDELIDKVCYPHS